ncbi:hypothetical protein OAQ99_03465 [Candidatus Kapabacteria bacterium]|nr:hypothetical protein [Candidatus Kapabacteria bacterium]
MKLILIILTIVLFTADSFSQSNCVIESEYEKIFKIQKMKYGEEEYLLKTVNVINASSCFSELVNNNGQYINYLRTHFSDNSNYDNLTSIMDTIELQHEFIKSLKNDSSFNEVMNILTKKITDKSNYIPDTISVDDLLNIAVKYFSIIKINKDGYYVGKVCAGINGIKQTEKERKPQIEAFCFTTLLSNYKGEQFDMYSEFVKGIKELYKINLGIENDDRLLRAQGAMYMFMKNNDKLKELLLSEYDNKKEYLPFVLKLN